MSDMRLELCVCIQRCDDTLCVAAIYGTMVTEKERERERREI